MLCLVIKLLGGNWFELATENTKFIQFCEFVDNTMWLKMLLACLIYVGSTYGLVCIILNKQYLNVKETIIFLLLMITKSLISWWFMTIATIIDLFILIVIPLILGKFKNWLRILICFALINVFQIMSILIRNIGLTDFNSNSFLPQTLIQVDYYIMIVLSYLYVLKRLKRKEV